MRKLPLLAVVKEVQSICDIFLLVSTMLHVGESEKRLVRTWRRRMPINCTHQCLLFDWLISLGNQRNDFIKLGVQLLARWLAEEFGKPLECQKCQNLRPRSRHAGLIKKPNNHQWFWIWVCQNRRSRSRYAWWKPAFWNSSCLTSVFSWWINVNGRPNCGNVATFSNSSCVS